MELEEGLLHFRGSPTFDEPDVGASWLDPCLYLSLPRFPFKTTVEAQSLGVDSEKGRKL